ncbi:glycosyltransferase, partial [Candidatus Woesearchaeota archaeon]|nr:glycosyltransferase [Candidatus Woesearchaeota archaeon]
MKLCLITEYFPESEKGELRGGVESRCYHIAQELSKKHTVYIITSSEKEDAVREYRIGRIKVISCCKHRYTHEGAFLSRLRFAWRAYRLWPLLEEKGIDLVDGQNFICCVPAYFAARKLHIPTVATYHEVWVGEWIRNKGIGTGMLGEVWERFVLKLSWNKIITVSHFTKDRLLQQGIREKDVAVVHNGVDLKKYKQYKHQRKVGKFSRPTICCISRLT